MKRLRSLTLGLPIAFFLLCPISSIALDAQKVYQKVKGSVYTLYSLDSGSREVQARGSAVAISKDILATNCHVALSGNYLVVKMPDGQKPQVAQLYYKNEHHDLCLLEVKGATFVPVKIRPSAKVMIGEEVYAVGNPKGTEKTLSKGIISNRHKVKGGIWLQTDAAIYFGSSGGGLFDENGDLIGITTKMGGNFGFAIPTEWITEVASAPRNSTLPQTQQTSAVDVDAIKGLSHIGTYGNDKIELYRNNDECFLLMRGKDPQGKFVSIIIWNPKYANLIVLFPSTKTADGALSIVHQAVLDKENESQTNFRSKSILHLGNRVYDLYGTRTKEKTYPFLIARLTKNTDSTLSNMDSVSATFQSQVPNIENVTVLYPLRGVSEAVSAYKVQCH